ncbi:MAG: hypothetical protein HYY16_04985 [Planctomycetes bacterium]|nr:hypothetical protein [Planctomycetota bacterium]
MTWAIEKDIRLEALRAAPGIEPSQFMEACGALEEKPAGKLERVRLQVVRSA